LADVVSLLFIFRSENETKTLLGESALNFCMVNDPSAMISVGSSITEEQVLVYVETISMGSMTQRKRFPRRPLTKGNIHDLAEILNKLCWFMFSFKEKTKQQYLIGNYPYAISLLKAEKSVGFTDLIFGFRWVIVAKRVEPVSQA
jgi:hypothetical protein